LLVSSGSRLYLGQPRAFLCAARQAASDELGAQLDPFQYWPFHQRPKKVDYTAGWMKEKGREAARDFAVVGDVPDGIDLNVCNGPRIKARFRLLCEEKIMAYSDK